MGSTPRDKNGPDTPIASAHPHKPNAVWLPIHRRLLVTTGPPPSSPAGGSVFPAGFLSQKRAAGFARVRRETLLKNG
jgi:hypothetical protein